MQTRPMDRDEQEEQPWLHPEDPWYGRSYVGDELNTRPRLVPRVATFYGSDEESEPDEVDLSDVDGEGGAPEDESGVTVGRRCRLWPSSRAYFEPCRMSEAAYEEMLARMAPADEA